MHRKPDTPLDYARPTDDARDDTRDNAKRTAAGCFGATLAIVTAPFLWVAIRSLLHLFGGWNKFIRSDQCPISIIGLIIGLIGLVAAFRWLWYAFRG